MNIPRRTRNLVVTALAPVVLLGLVWKTTAPQSVAAEPSTVAAPYETPSPMEAVEVPAEGDASAPAPGGERTRLYAIALYRLKGISESTAPGTNLEIWVSWTPDGSQEPELQRLINHAVLELIEPGPVPEAPAIATLRVGVKDIPNLIWGEMFGELAAAIKPAE